MERNYAETVDYLFGLLPMYQRTGALAGKLDLSKTEALLEALGDPHRGLRVVHVGGTNGKGTVSHAVASLCTAAGLRVGLYTSPHYVDYRERIRIDGVMLSEAYVTDFVTEHRGLIEEVGASFFEFTVAMAFSYFAEQRVDLAVVEVGMGGRLDSTNVVDPLVSVITNIDLDHTDILGDTLGAIAIEKAGIIKPGRPVVIGREQAETLPVFREVARSRGAPMHEAWAFPQNQLAGVDRDSLSVRGPFAAENTRTALTAYEVLRKHIDLGPAVPAALSRMPELSGYGGRFEAYRRDGHSARVIADAGHNPAAWTQTVPAVLVQARGSRCHVVCGFVKGKDPVAFASGWPAGTPFYIGDLDLPRNKPSVETLAILHEHGCEAVRFGSIAEAYEAALNEAAPDELIFVGGSSFVVGAWRAHVRA